LTGGSQGIGEAISQAYAREGAKVVVVNSRNPAQGEKIANEIVEAGGMAIATRCDVSRMSEVKSLIQEVLDRFGTVDILVSNAGIMINKQIEDYTEDEWDLMIDVNLKGSFLTAQAVVPLMKEKRSGKIIFMASIAGSVAFPNAVPYCASKGGVILIMKALAAEVSKFGINVNSISPGNTATPLNQHLQDNPDFVALLESFTPTERAYISTDEMAGAAIFLASEEASAVHGHDLIVDDGWCAI
jgi:NAD(P)-dependent dehydrogenase (short-subunit alcohol dehydrogenase family)